MPDRQYDAQFQDACIKKQAWRARRDQSFEAQRETILGLRSLPQVTMWGWWEICRVSAIASPKRYGEEVDRCHVDAVNVYLVR